MERHGPWLSIDLSALTRNARRFQQLVGSRLLPMVKANGYGLGAAEVSRALEAVNPWGYGVATAGEAAELRAAGIGRPIVAFLPLQVDQLESYLEHDVRPVIGDFAALDAWLAASSRPFHLSLDTGMSRVGFRAVETGVMDELGGRLAAAPGWEGATTHFHSSDTDAAATALQWTRFTTALAALPRRPSLVHVANSGTAQYGTRYHGDLARPGIFLYGGRAGTVTPDPVARLEARVLALRDLRPGDSVSYQATFVATRPVTIATLGIGYADGLHRTLGGRALVEWQGTLYPVVGRVTMDMTMAAVPAGVVSLGDRVTIFGGRVTLDDYAAAAGTISYEMLTALGRRVVRLYRH